MHARLTRGQRTRPGGYVDSVVSLAQCTVDGGPPGELTFGQACALAAYCACTLIFAFLFERRADAIERAIARDVEGGGSR
jgi:hypothetical protein